MRRVARYLLRDVRRCLLASVPILGLLSGSASADLIEVDLSSAGDGLVTRDTATALDWLDLTLTTNLSVNAVLGGAGGWLPAGWRYATDPEVLSLWFNGGIVEIGLAGSPANLPGITLLIGLLGETLSGGGTYGLVASDCPDCRVNYLFPNLGSSFVGVASMGDVFYGADHSDAATGHWLVRDAIPEPATAVLLMAATRSDDVPAGQGMRSTRGFESLPARQLPGAKGP